MPDHTKVISEVLRIEDGHANLEGDAGGETFYGISQLARAEYEGELGLPWPPTRESAAAFYLHWWTKAGYARLPISNRMAVQLMLLRVHKNETVAAELLQVALCRLGEPVAIDGVIGPKTIQALEYAEEGELYDHFVSAAAGWYTSRTAFKRFGQAWLSHRLRVQVKR